MMRLLANRPKRKLWGGAAIVLLLLAVLGCSMGDFLPAQPTSTPIPTNTATFTRTPSKTPTPTLTPTVKQGLVAATTKPTLRPSWTPIPTNTLRPTWTASPTLSPTVTSPVGILLEEDFNDDDPYAPWMKKKGSNWATGIAKKMYFMSVYGPKIEITSARTWLKLDEVRIEADITHNNGNGYYGFHCRETPGGTYYTIFITTDGYYGFGQFNNDKTQFLRYAPLPKQDPPIDPKGTNHIRADCRGDALTLYVNGEAVDRIQIIRKGKGY
ncbi:MAG: hypothetical protein ACK2T5_08505, partial [Anaerolineales bacterium]